MNLQFRLIHIASSGLSLQMISNIRCTMHPAETTEDEDIKFLISTRNIFLLTGHIWKTLCWCSKELTWNQDSFQQM